jgi:hypothetical protein
MINFMTTEELDQAALTGKGQKHARTSESAEITGKIESEDPNYGMPEFTIETLKNYHQSQITELKDLVVRRDLEIGQLKSGLHQLFEQMTIFQKEQEEMRQENLALRKLLSQPPPFLCGQLLPHFPPGCGPLPPPFPMPTGTSHPSMTPSPLSPSIQPHSLNSNRVSEAATSVSTATAAAVSVTTPTQSRPKHQQAPPTSIPAPKPYLSAAKKAPPITIRQTLKLIEKPEDKLTALLRQPLTEDQLSTKVCSATFSLPLTAKARQDPWHAWEEAVKALTGITPLAVSLHAPGKGEVFYDFRHQNAIHSSLSKVGTLHEEALVEKDIKRRARAYLNGYFKTLRLATLQGFSVQQQVAVLAEAEELLKAKKSFNSSKRSKWQKTITYDRQFILNPTLEEMQM